MAKDFKILTPEEIAATETSNELSRFDSEFWKATEDGDTIKGQIIDYVPEKGQYNLPSYTILDETGTKYDVSAGHKDLRAKLNKCELGDVVSITYEGEQLKDEQNPAKGVFKRYKVYKQ